MPPRIDDRWHAPEEAAATGESPPGLEDQWIAILDRIAVGTHAAILRSALRADGHDEATLDVMAEEGWLVAWDLSEIHKKVRHRLRAWLPKDKGSMRLVSISPWAAERLRLELVQEGANERPRWGKMIDEGLLRLGLPQPTSPLPSYAGLPTQPDHYEAIVFAAFRLPDNIPDERAAKPEDAAIAAEEFAMAEQFDEEEGRPRLDLETGRPVKQPVVVWGKDAKAEDEGLKGGLDGRHDGRIPVDPRIKGKKGKAK